MVWLVFPSWTDEEKIILHFAILVSFPEEEIVLKYWKAATYLHETDLKIQWVFMKVISVVDSVVTID